MNWSVCSHPFDDLRFEVTQRDYEFATFRGAPFWLIVARRR